MSRQIQFVILTIVLQITNSQDQQQQEISIGKDLEQFNYCAEALKGILFFSFYSWNRANWRTARRVADF